ncbi:NADP-dependent oxidoreductase [Agromyces sp. H3Y2-19a]|uniref:NADP-dependent oxidoreductase n=1 Tax=Agromyces TaxID=33877 RepID=UPI001E4B4C75|nr:MULTISPECIES: NADP-dependent oxidoreductase [Agromyces]MCD5346508.1 NADP-dependent oxidoreductase [Agromyces sp. S2-1-8]MDF0512871.1 NADP-dependent oxidoreductase [Agromyces chromiiresistens]
MATRDESRAFTARAVRYAEFGGPEVLHVDEVPMPVPGDGEVLVEVFAAGLNPAESATRRGEHDGQGPIALPAMQGRDLAGVVIATGPDVGRFGRGDEVMGFVERGAQATHVAVPERQLLPKPAGLSWEVAGSLYVAGTTAWNAVEGLALGPDDTVVVTAAAGGVGCLAVQFARMRGATVIGTTTQERFDFLRQFGVIPTRYGPGLAERVRAIVEETEHARPVSAFLDFLGGETDAAAELGVASSRTLTVLDHEAVEADDAVAAGTGDVVAMGRVAALVAARRVRLPIADVFGLDGIVDAYRALDRRDAPGKIVLGLRVVDYPGQKVREPAIKEQDVTLGVPTPHAHMEVTEAIPPAIGDGSVRRRHREEHEREQAAAAE